MHPRWLLVGPMAVAALVAAAPGCTEEDPVVPTEGTLPLEIQTATRTVRLRVEVADTPEEQARGLMGRTSIGPADGMVFLYSAPTDGSFTMRETLLPLSIAFWDEGGRIVDLFDMEPCPEEPCPGYYPAASYVGALEVPRGLFEDRDVRIGDVVRVGS